MDILLTIEFYAHVHSSRFVLPRAIDNDERTIKPKRRDSLIQLKIIVSIIIFTDTCVCVVENRPSVFIEIHPDSYHHTNNIPSSDRTSRCLICNGRIDLILRT